MFNAGQLLVFRPASEIALQAAAGAARLMLLGGEPMDGPRHICWNFVSSSQERHRAGEGGLEGEPLRRGPEETEFIPLPEEPAPVRYP